jgi:hypothetical protein
MDWPTRMSRNSFFIFTFDHEFLKGVKRFKALTVKIYLINDDLRGRQVLMFPELYSE